MRAMKDESCTLIGRDQSAVPVINAIAIFTLEDATFGTAQ